MKERSFVNDNKGFSLVELIVTVLISGILMMAVGMFLSSSRQTYQTVNVSTTLQEEAMTVERAISEFFMEAKKYDFEEDVDISLSPSIKADVLWMLCRDNEHPTDPDKVYFFVLDKDKQVLRYCTGNRDYVQEDADVNSITEEGKKHIKNLCYGSDAIKRFSIIGEHITEMKTTSSKSRPDGTDLVVLNIKYSFMDKEYKSTVSAVTRNRTHEPESSSSGGSTSGESTPGGSGEPI